MKAALVTSFDVPPAYRDVPDPVAHGPHELVVDVLAAGLHPRVRSQADGSHYSSTGDLPLVPGVDGVGRGPGGELRYFVLPDTSLGAMAEQTVIDPRRSVVLPDGADPIAIAAAMNPAMSSWVALRRRIEFRQGQQVLVLGATGNAGSMALQVATLFGAGRIVAVGRGAERVAGLTALGATDTVALDGTEDELTARLGEVAAEVDVVIDYLWGRPAIDTMLALVTGRADRGRNLAWIQIGSVAGADAAVPSAALRSTRLQIVGSGQGSVGAGAILAELPSLAQAVTDGTIRVDPRPVPLADVERVWTDARTSSGRIVITP